jgi:hypothetical protein
LPPIIELPLEPALLPVPVVSVIVLVELVPVVLVIGLVEPVPVVFVIVPVEPVPEPLVEPAPFWLPQTYVREAQTALYWLFVEVKFGTVTAVKPPTVVVMKPLEPVLAPLLLPVPVVFVVVPVALVPVVSVIVLVAPVLELLLVPAELKSLWIQSCKEVALPAFACWSSTT